MRIPSLNDVRTMDGRRASFPGEHVAVTSVGAAALLMAARGPASGSAMTSPLARLALGGLGLALLARGVSGRDGLAGIVSRKLSARRDSAQPAATNPKP